MGSPFFQQAKEWFERGDHDIEMAQLLYDENGYTDTIAFLIQQGVEKYLKGFLVFHGKKIEKAYRTHDLGFLPNANRTFLFCLDMEYALP